MLHLLRSWGLKANSSQVDLFAQCAVPPDSPSIGRAGNHRRVHHTAVSDDVATLHVLVDVLILRRDVDKEVAVLGHVTCVCVGGGRSRGVQ